MGDKKADISKLVILLEKGVKKYGVAVVSDNLRRLYSTLDLSHNAKRNLVIRNRIYTEVGAEFSVTKREILRSTKHGNHAQAKIMAIILLHKHLGLPKTEIARMFSHKQTRVIDSRLRSFNSFIGYGPASSHHEARFEKIYSQNKFMAKYNRINKKIVAEKAKWGARAK